LCHEIWLRVIVEGDESGVAKAHETCQPSNKMAF
jgi:hypothetical protein